MLENSTPLDAIGSPMDFLSAKEEFKEIVETAKNERPVQVFLEKYPNLFPSGPRHVIQNLIISQLPLGSDHIPDFGYVFFNSTGVYLTLFEIESPQMKIFLEDDNFSKPYLNAIQQTEDWLRWTESNQSSLFSMFAPLIQNFAFAPPMGVFCILVAGRRSQLTNIVRQRRYKQKCQQYYPHVEIMTYDRFLEEVVQHGVGSLDKDLKCVCYKKQSFFEKEIATVRTQSFS